MKSLVGDEHVPLDKYQNSKVKIKFKHRKCGNIFSMTPNSFFNGHRCPKCALKQVHFNNRKTDAEFKAEVKALVGNEYAVMGKYSTRDSKIRFKHQKCGNTFEMRPNNFLNGSRCPKCIYKRSALKHNKMFKAQFYKVAGQDYILVGDYKDSRQRIIVLHVKCGCLYKVFPENFLHGRKCPYCASIKRSSLKTSESQFKTKVQKIGNGNFVPLQEYKGAMSKILMLHQICGHAYYVTPNNFFNGKGCPYCSRKKANQKLRNAGKRRFSKMVAMLSKKYEVTGKYIDYNSVMQCRCLKCGFTWQTKAKKIMRNHGCPKCAIDKNTQRKRHNSDWFKKEIKRTTGNEYKLVSAYKTFNEKVKLMHLPCGHIYSVTPNKFIYGRRCPYCSHSMSKGEKCVAQYLEKHHFSFKSQYWIQQCKDKYVLPFDFAVFNSNKTLNCLIEYQGEQHFYNPFTYGNQWFSKESVLRTQKHDAMKLQYCKDHGIKLIRINHPQTSSKSNSIEFIKRLVNRTLTKELHVV